MWEFPHTAEWFPRQAGLDWLQFCWLILRRWGGIRWSTLWRNQFWARPALDCSSVSAIKMYLVNIRADQFWFEGKLTWDDVKKIILPKPVNHNQKIAKKFNFNQKIGLAKLKLIHDKAYSPSEPTTSSILDLKLYFTTSSLQKRATKRDFVCSKSFYRPIVFPLSVRDSLNSWLFTYH